jgi:ABC-type transport system involved in multi-copper enzyme maturation permease subunit
MRALLRAELTKLRTVRGWLFGLAGIPVAILGLGVLAAAGTHTSCMRDTVEVTCPAPPVGPDGEVVTDHFTFVHQAMDGDGTLTAHVASMTGIITYPPPDHDQIVPGVEPWSKAGIMVKDGTKEGSAYAAVLLTGSHGVRMQHDFTHDTAGPAGARWLRLSRSGDRITGYASSDGTAWSRIGTVTLRGLPRTVRAGLFVASPSDITHEASPMGGSIVQARWTQTTATFDGVDRTGGWTATEVGDDGGRTDWEKNHQPAGFTEADGKLVLSGSGDIAPAGAEAGPTIAHTLAGGVLALLVVTTVGVLFMTAEYRRGLIRTTLTATPRRARVVAAKAIVIGAVTFVVGLAAIAVTVPLATHLLESSGTHVAPAGIGTALRVIVGTALLLALAAVLAYSLGSLLRRGILAVTAAVVLIVLPFLLATTSVLPTPATQWLLRVTPAAAFAIQQTIPAYAQVLYPYTPADGYYPLAPWAGLAVLAAWAVAGVGLAAVRIRRGDA